MLMPMLVGGPQQTHPSKTFIGQLCNQMSRGRPEAFTEFGLKSTEAGAAIEAGRQAPSGKRSSRLAAKRASSAGQSPGGERGWVTRSNWELLTRTGSSNTQAQQPIHRSGKQNPVAQGAAATVLPVMDLAPSLTITCGREARAVPALLSRATDSVQRAFTTQ